MTSRIHTAVLLLSIGLSYLAFQRVAASAAVAVDKENQQPILRLEPGGPTTFLSSLAFSPDGRTLYAAGSDKVVYVWTREAVSGEFGLVKAATYRLPIGPGMHGVLNALAVSPDGSWLAVAGQGVLKVASDMRHPGIEVPEMGGLDEEGYRQQGTIYVFDTRQRTATRLIGHLGPVLTLAFAPAAAGKPPLLVSAATEWDSATGKSVATVRLWDAAHGKYLGGVQVPTTLRMPVRPALVAWHTGPEISQLRVAVAWGDTTNRLRVWDVAKNVLPDAPDSYLNNVAVAGPAPGQLLTGCYGGLKLWRLPADGGQAPTVERELKLAETLPRAITLFASRADGRMDRAAVVVRIVDPMDKNRLEDRLRLIDLDKFQWLATDVPLWSGSGTMPMPAVRAVVPGRHIAVTGGTMHELLVFAIDDLLAGRARSQSLVAPGITPRFAEFVSRKNRLGLLVSQQSPAGPESNYRPPAHGDLIFDPDTGAAGPDPGWTPSVPQTQGWKLTQRPIPKANPQPAEAYYEVQVQSPDGRTVSIRLKADYKPTAYAILPPNPRFSIPLVAVAATFLGQPSLHIYNGDTGEPIRTCQAHVEQIRSLGFSADGRFLLSVGDDRLICVWSLLDLGEILGKRGALPEVALKQVQGKVAVAAVGKASPPQLLKGDVLDGIVEQGRWRAIASPLEFYLALSHVKPGETAVLARSRGDGRQEQVPVRVGQGVDERKPLFALFLTRNANDKPWQWIGWSPLGWYDASQNTAELLGWHFNTPDSAEPARFARAEEYPKLHYPGLLPELLDGKTPVDRTPPLPRPAMSLSVEEPDQSYQLVETGDVAIYRHRDAELRLRLTGPAADHVAQIGWHVGSGSATPCQEVGSREWSIPLQSFPWSRAEQKLRIAFRTGESEPQDFTEETAVRYRPLPPAITAIAPDKVRSVVHEAEFSFHAGLASLDPKLAQQVQVTLLQTAGSAEVFSKSWLSPAKADIEKPLTLARGDNFIQLTAVNVSGGTPVIAESTVLTRTVTYSPIAVSPPQMALSLFETADGSAALSEANNGTILVDQPVIHVRGEIKAEEPLKELSWRGDKSSPLEPVAGFQPLRDQLVKVARDIPLKPGLQTIWFSAKTEHSLRTGIGWNVFYRPPLPQLVWTSPAGGADFVAGRDNRSLVVTGRFLANDGGEKEYPIEMSILRNGNPLPLKTDVDAQKRTFAAKVQLEPGVNRLQWRATHAWGGQALSEVRTARYLRLPAISKVEAPSDVKEPFVDCTVHVETPADLPLQAMTLNDRPVPLGGAVLEKHGSDADLWKIAVPRIPLVEGANAIVFSARNEDGWALEPRRIAVKVTVPPPPKAEVDFRWPLEDMPTDYEILKVRVNVKSASRIQGLSLRCGDKGVWRAEPADLAKQVDHGLDGFEFLAEQDVTLSGGVNALEAVAINRGGESRKSVRATYVQPPIRLVIDGIDQHGKGLAARPEEGGQLVFSESASDGIVQVHGRIFSTQEGLKSLGPKTHLYVSVNGFMQPQEIVFGQPGPVQTWQAKIRLNQAKNKVTVLVPGLIQDAANRCEFHVDCQKPDTKQRLLLLVVSIPKENKETLTRQALEAVQGRLVGPRKDFTTPAFDHGRIVATLTGEWACRPAVRNQLHNIAFAFHNTIGGRDDVGNDVVLIYYRGPEAVEKSGEFVLLTSENDGSTGLSAKNLNDAFKNAPGAQVFLLDVQHSTPSAKTPRADRSVLPPWPPESRFAAMRCAWLNRSQAPADAGLLLAALKRVVPSATNLYEINANVLRDLQGKSDYGETLIYDQYIPDDLRTLALRKP